MNRDADWHDRAACVGYPITVFYVERGETYDTAKAICSTCDVRTHCLAAVLAFEQPAERHGFIAGLTPNERARVARDLAIPARRTPPTTRGHGTVAGYGRGCRCDGCRDARSRYVADRHRAHHPDNTTPASPLRLRHATGNAATPTADKPHTDAQSLIGAT